MNRNAMLMVAILLTIAIADYSYEKKIKTRSLLFTCNYNIRLHLQAKNTPLIMITFSSIMKPTKMEPIRSSIIKQ